MDLDIEELMVVNQINNDMLEAEADANNPPRQMYNVIDPFATMNDDQFMRLFRVSKNLAEEIINLVTPYMRQGQTYSSLQIKTKVLVALLFYAHGSYQKVTGNTIFAGISQASVSRSIREVTYVLNNENIVREWIKFPQNIDELQALRTRFYTRYNIPGVIGCIDCTHVAIVRPNEAEHIYINRKHYHSLNVQLVCDENLRIMNVVARFPGSAHDAHIWRQCNLSQLLERLYRENNQNLFYLLGDLGYPLRPWLLTPLRDPIPGTPEERFNNAVTSVRSIIERCNGLLKNRWRCLLKHRVLHYSPEISANIIKACCVLHNMCIARNLPLPEHEEFDDNGIPDIPLMGNDQNENADLRAARNIRQQLINNYFQ